MKTDNELIAEFMGAERREGPRVFNPDQTLVQWVIKGNPYNQHRDDIKHWYQPVELKYHESWDWLMPVVGKIESLGDSNDFVFESAEFHELMELSIKTSIVRVYWFVVEFIKWYNTQPKEATSQQQSQSE